MSVIKKEMKMKNPGRSVPTSYFVPNINMNIKVERKHHRTYVAHFPTGLEKVELGDMISEKWQCLGEWKDESLQ